MRTTRRLALLGACLGVAYLLGVPLADRVVGALLTAAHGAAAVFVALLAPRPAERPPPTPLHAALLNITNDAGRAADLMHEFIALEGDPALQQRFLAFLTHKAATSYTRVDQQLSWVLWIYSTLWMPLLVVLCLSRGAASSRRRGGRERQRVAPAAAGGAADWPPAAAPLQHSASLPARRAEELAGGGGALLRRSATVGVPRRVGGGSGIDGVSSSREAGIWGEQDASVSAPSDQALRQLGSAWTNGAGLKITTSRSLKPVAEGVVA